jgi:hypothetical protein
MKFILIAMLMVTAAWGQGVSAGSWSSSGPANWGSGNVMGSVCGPPGYLCSRTDTTIHPLADPNNANPKHPPLLAAPGDVMFMGASTGVLGGLYPGTISIGGCWAGFLATPNGTQSNLQALVNGAPSGTAMTTVAGHHYVLTTRLYSLELYRRQQLFHSSTKPAGSGRGGVEIGADVRVVLEIHDIDPANPATQVAASIVLFDGVISSAPDFCNYALVNTANLQCAIAFSRLIRAVDAEVRTASPGMTYVTRLVGSLSDGAECSVTSSELGFFSSYVPATNQLIVVRYRGSGRALARVTNPVSIAAELLGADNGVRGAVRHVKYPKARTAVDCENAALALLDDATTAAWSGTYETWSDFLPGNATDVFPGDALDINMPSRGAIFQAIVREVNIAVKDLAGDHCVYQVQFANDAAETLSFEFQAAQIATSLDVLEMTNQQVGSIFLADLTAAAVTQVTIDHHQFGCGNNIAFRRRSGNSLERPGLGP